LPAPHDLDPDWLSEEDRLAKRRYDAYFAFETMPDREVPMTPHEIHQLAEIVLLERLTTFVVVGARKGRILCQPGGAPSANEIRWDALLRKERS
jgi:hypothetical protein